MSLGAKATFVNLLERKKNEEIFHTEFHLNLEQMFLGQFLQLIERSCVNDASRHQVGRVVGLPKGKQLIPSDNTEKLVMN